VTEKVANTTQDLQKEMLGRLNVELQNPTILTEKLQETNNEEDLITKSGDEEEFKG